MSALERTATEEVKRVPAGSQHGATTYCKIVTLDTIDISVDDRDFERRALARWENEGGRCSPNTTRKVAPGS